MKQKYFKSELDFQMLCGFKNAYSIIKKEYNAFVNDPIIAYDNLRDNMSTAAKSIKSNKTDWKVFGLLMHGRSPADIIKEYSLSFNGKSTEELIKLANYIFLNHFQESQKILLPLIKDEANGIISVWFSQFQPGTKLGLHINNDPYMYRAHLGIDIPEDGDIGFKVCDDITRWKNGEILVFDPTNPHTAWNLSNKPRTVLIVDFFKPEQNRETMKELEAEQYKLMMAQNPNSFGMSGGMFDLEKLVHEKYAIPEIENNCIKYE